MIEDAMREMINRATEMQNTTVEQYLQAYMKVTGLGIDDIVLCTVNDWANNRVMWWAMKKDKRVFDMEKTDDPTE